MVLRVLPQKFGTRLFAITLTALLVPLLVFLILVQSFENHYSRQTQRLLLQGKQEISKQSEDQVKKVAELQIQLRAKDVAVDIAGYLRTHPEMTVADLQQDAVFRALAIQKVGLTGYTAVQDSDLAINRFHQNREIEDLDLHTLGESLPAFWEIMSKSLGGKESFGDYQWREPDGTLREKFMYIVPVLEKTADGVSLGVAATTYVDEFLVPIREAEQVLRQTLSRLTEEMDQLLRSSVQTGLLLLLLGTMAISVLAYFIGRYFSKAITGLREATQAVNRGDLSIHLKPAMTGEVGELTEDFNRMVSRLAATTVSKERLERSELLLRKSNALLKGQIERRLQAEGELKAHRDQLAERTAQLERVNRELEELDRLKDSFLSSISHEFRTPLTAIQSFIDILLSYPEEEFETKKEFLTIIRNETERLTRLINNLLDLSKIRAGRMAYHLSRFRLEPVVRNAVKSLWSLFSGKDLKVYQHLEQDLPEMIADQDRVFQVFTNLLNNAIKFTEPGGEIRIRAELIREASAGGEPLIHISVSDNGAGIPPHMIPMVFDTFIQASDTLEHSSRGTGLGLSICREIISSHGGRIWVESEHGKGSTFHIHLPVAPPPLPTGTST